MSSEETGFYKGWRIYHDSQRKQFITHFRYRKLHLEVLAPTVGLLKPLIDFAKEGKDFIVYGIPAFAIRVVSDVPPIIKTHELIEILKRVDDKVSKNQ